MYPPILMSSSASLHDSLTVAMAVMSMAAAETAAMGVAAAAHGGGAAVAACISTRGVQQSARAREV